MDQAQPGAEIALSVVIPLYNEEGNVAPLCDALLAALAPTGLGFEIILVNDGSRDGTEARLIEAAKRDQRIRVLNFRSNTGQTAAMMAGIAKGGCWFTGSRARAALCHSDLHCAR